MHNLPNTWKSYNLGDICSFNGGLWTGKKPPFEKAYVIRNTNFTKCDGRLDLNKVAELEVESAQLKNRTLEYGDIILEKSGGGPKQPVGRVALFDIKDKLNFTYSNFTSRIRINKDSDVSPLFLWRYLSYVYNCGNIEHYQKQTHGIRNLEFDLYKRLSIPVPPIETQDKIVSILDEADNLIKLRNQADDKMKELIPALFDEMFGDPFGNENDWPVRSLDDIALDVQYGTSAKANEDSDGIPVLRMNNLNYDGSWDLTNLKHTELSNEEYDKYTVHYGDMLINRTNSRELVGKTAVWNKDYSYAFAGYLVRFRLNPKIANPFYVSSALNLPSGKKLLFSMAKPAVNMSNISASDMKRIRMAMPPVELQDKFSEQAREVVSNQGVISEARQKLDNLFNSLMDRCMSGEIC